MDLAVLRKKVFFIPTPGQFEQEYLASFIKEQSIAPFSKQQDFSLEKLNEIENYKGFNTRNSILNLQLFNLFQGK